MEIVGSYAIESFTFYKSSKIKTIFHTFMDTAPLNLLMYTAQQRISIENILGKLLKYSMADLKTLQLYRQAKNDHIKKLIMVDRV